MTNARRQTPKPNRFCIEFTLDDPAALDQEWNYTDRATRLHEAGHRLLLRGFFAEAADVFERATRYDRAHYDAYVGRTEALILSGEDEAAARVANDALERYGRNCRLGAARGHVFLHQQDLQNARTCTDIATRNAPESAYVWVIAGEVRVAQHDALKSAMDCFARARRARGVGSHAPSHRARPPRMGATRTRAPFPRRDPQGRTAPPARLDIARGRAQTHGRQARLARVLPTRGRARSGARAPAPRLGLETAHGG